MSDTTPQEITDAYLGAYNAIYDWLIYHPGVIEFAVREAVERYMNEQDA